ncbi:MAG: hypothetical protein WD002_00065 [Pseudomonadales bacterium]
MAYLAIAVILLVIIAPILAILPSKRQKEQMFLRKKAMADGFSVELTRIDDPDPDPEKYLSNTGKPLERVMSVAAYRFPRRKPPDWRRLPNINWALVRRRNAVGQGLPANWVWDEPPPGEMSRELRAYIAGSLQKLPDDVVRVDESKYVISVYWTERGGEVGVAAIITFVKACAEISPFDPRLFNDK